MYLFTVKVTFAEQVSVPIVPQFIFRCKCRNARQRFAPALHAPGRNGPANSGRPDGTPTPPP
jgi:hypothetical protein